jgi:dTMP kinase
VASDPRDPDEPTTQPLGSLGSAPDERSLPDPSFDKRSTVVRLFGSDDFFRLWIAQVVSSLGDWIGIVAIIAIAGRVGHSASSVSFVLSARMIPGFFMAPVAGVLVDRWNRKRVMVTCDFARAAVLCTLPFIDTIWGLVLASFALEVATLLWSPAKEASVPNLVPKTHLATANSLSLAAAYGTFPIATLLFAFLAKVATWLSGIHALHFLRINQEFVAIYVDVLTFCLSALLISTLALRRPARSTTSTTKMRFDWGQTFRELREGWHFMFIDPTVRAIMVGIGTGLIGGGMVVPLGDRYSRLVLHGGSSGFGLLLTGMGFGMAAGVLLIMTMQGRIPKARVFCWSVIVAGAALVGAASTGTLAYTIAFVGLLGVCAGSVYVLGFTILQETVADELRGRIFSALYTLVRFCLLLSFSLGPLLAAGLGRVSKRAVDSHARLLGIDVALPGERLALWLAGIVILAAGLLAARSLRTGERREALTSS